MQRIKECVLDHDIEVCKWEDRVNSILVLYLFLPSQLVVTFIISVSIQDHG